MYLATSFILYLDSEYKLTCCVSENYNGYKFPNDFIKVVD